MGWALLAKLNRRFPVATNPTAFWVVRQSTFVGHVFTRPFADFGVAIHPMGNDGDVEGQIFRFLRRHWRTVWYNKDSGLWYWRLCRMMPAEVWQQMLLQNTCTIQALAFRQGSLDQIFLGFCDLGGRGWAGPG